MSLPFCEVILGVGVDIVLIYKRECILVSLFQVTIGESSHVVSGSIPVNLRVSADRREVTCSAEKCGVCGARGGVIILEAEGTDVILHSVRLL